MTRIKQDPKRAGDFLSVSSPGGEDVFLLVRLDATNATLMLSYKTGIDTIQTLYFSHPDVSLADGEWHRLVLIIDTDNAKIYIDCALIGRKALSPPILSSLSNYRNYALTLGDSRNIFSQLFHVSSGANSLECVWSELVCNCVAVLS